MKLSKDFELKEFTYSSSADIYIDPTPMQMFLLKRLVVNIIQPIRDYIGEPLYVASGIRNKTIMNKLISIGLSPSRRTDHSYGDPEVNPYGVGAADIYTENRCLLPRIHKYILANHNVSQSILYEPVRWRQGFIHVSNPMSVFVEALQEYDRHGKLQDLVWQDGKYMTTDNEIEKRYKEYYGC